MEKPMNAHKAPQLLLAVLALATAVAHAVPVIPEESGWSGHLNLGVGAGSSDSNMLAGISSIDLGDDTISSLEDSPGSEDIVMPVLQFELAYTLGDTFTQVYLGNQSADYISFDSATTLETHLGVRQYIADIGTVDISLSASSLATDVWKDPYVVDSARGDTERTTSGINITWGDIMGSSFDFSWSSKEIEIDDEESGVALDLSRADQRLLRREGRYNRIDLYYEWEINEHHSLVPSIGYLDFDLDGDAMAEDGMAAQLKYSYKRDRWRFVTNVFYQDLESDTGNPIYGDTREVETIGGSITGFYAKPFGLENWTANASASYYDGDSTIDFYDSSFGLVSVGMFYRFD